MFAVIPAAKEEMMSKREAKSVTSAIHCQQPEAPPTTGDDVMCDCCGLNV